MATSTTNYTPYFDLEKALQLHFKSAALETFSPQHGTTQDGVDKWKFLKSNETPESWMKKIGNFVGNLFSWFSTNEGPKVGLDNVWKYCKDAYPTFPDPEFEASYIKAEMNLTTYLQKNTVPTQVQNKTKAVLNQRLYPKVQISVETKMGKEILVVKRPVLLVGLFLKEIEAKLANNAKIEEIHLVASEIIYIDCHLRLEKWHGKNVVLVTKHAAVVVPDRLWDLSGSPGENLFTAKYGSENGDIDGKDGIEGKAGECGGNLTLIADSFVNMDWLTIKLNGGEGGKGQNGGDGLFGKQGKIGAEMTIETLLTELPSPAKSDGFESKQALRTTLIKLNSIIDHYETSWSNGIDLERGMKANIGYTSIGCHIKGRTMDGCLIEFGYYEKQNVEKHAYCLVTGGLGMPGGLGGFGGYGGVGANGGYKGKLAVLGLADDDDNESQVSCDLKWEAYPGLDGGRGQDGKDMENGECGRNGIDVGYVDRDTWTNAVTYTGTLKVVNDPRSNSKAAWCPKLQKWRGIESTTRKQPQPVVDERVKRERPQDGEVEEAKERQPIDNDQVRNEYVDEVLKEISFPVEY